MKRGKLLELRLPPTIIVKGPQHYNANQIYDSRIDRDRRSYMRRISQSGRRYHKPN